jgi:Domain of unknown function (DUF4865)
MVVKQYTIKLPADYDMEIIRARVRDRGAVFDNWPGLGFKAFLISEAAAGATANRYAPFYLWQDENGANEFLYGDGFAGIGSSFGRPLIEHWIPLGFRRAGAATARSAVRVDVPVTDDEDLGAVHARERQWLEAAGDEVYAAVVALDPYRWQLVRFALFESEVGELPVPPTATAYEVLRLSAPGL